MFVELEQLLKGKRYGMGGGLTKAKASINNSLSFQQKTDMIN